MEEINKNLYRQNVNNFAKIISYIKGRGVSNDAKGCIGNRE